MFSLKHVLHSKILNKQQDFTEDSGLGINFGIHHHVDRILDDGTERGHLDRNIDRE